MVATQEGKLKSVKTRSNFKKTTRRASGGIRQNIPFNIAEVITRTEVARKVKNRVLTKSTKVVIPVVPSSQFEPPDFSPPSPPDQEVPTIPSKQTRKGPSRSVAVHLSPPPFPSTN
jgi:hypothetical protein